MTTDRDKASARRPASLALLAALLILQSAWNGPARADTIDGHWCRPDGQLPSIAGPRIITPRERQDRRVVACHLQSRPPLVLVFGHDP